MGELPPLHEEPFPELRGHASQVTVSADGRWIAVSSVLHQQSRVAVHRADDLSCAHLLMFAMDAESIAFHPTLPLLAVGLDNYDEYDRAGGLTLFEPDNGRRVDFADPRWGVDPVRWLDARTLELTFFRVDEHDEYVRYASRGTLVRDDWLGLAPDALDLTALEREPLDPEATDTYPDQPGSPAGPLLAEIAERAGRTYDGLGGVRAVAGLSDGRVLATRRDTAVECWAPDGTLLWRVPAEPRAHGTRIEVAADERTARITVPGPDARARTDFPLVSTADGTVLDRPSVPFSAALQARTDGVWAIRDTYNRSIEVEPPTPPNTRFFAPDGTPLGGVQEPNRYDLVPLDVRRCPELLYGRRGRDVVALDPRTTAETTLHSVDAPLGPAVHTVDAEGPALLHGRKELVRRAHPTGEIAWTRPLESEVVALDAHDGILHALCADDTLVSVATTDGTVLAHRPLPPYGLLSLHAAPDGTVLIGTSAGRILRY
ncbi:PQQ-binding-like beta-propeller repeat protein [Streptomyces sp. NPDC047981]|uniref:PQQ-binding-like beta-propeller repeat protein n=1 Tax=Streptomyces sp. NPDC047981 TaxID=3154610 RepID=UPI00341AB6E7